MAHPIHPDMKVEEVLERYPHLLPVFLEHGFTPLRNPLLRRTFAPRVTLTGAARIRRWKSEQFDAFLEELRRKAVPADGCVEASAQPEPPADPLYDLADVEGLRAQSIVVDGDVVHIDNRGLEPPNPMVRILAIAQQLKAGQRIEAINDRQPQMLYPVLKDLGLGQVTTPLRDGSYQIVITKGD